MKLRVCEENAVRNLSQKCLSKIANKKTIAEDHCDFDWINYNERSSNRENVPMENHFLAEAHGNDGRDDYSEHYIDGGLKNNLWNFPEDYDERVEEYIKKVLCKPAGSHNQPTKGEYEKR